MGGVIDGWVIAHPPRASIPFSTSPLVAGDGVLYLNYGEHNAVAAFISSCRGLCTVWHVGLLGSAAARKSRLREPDALSARVISFVAGSDRNLALAQHELSLSP